MASIFTYETEPIDISSPWPFPALSDRDHSPTSVPRPPADICGLKVPPLDRLERYKIKKLIPEPQDGPVEYKLHLLLRQRRSFISTSTVDKIPGSYLSKSRSSTTSIESSTGQKLPLSGLAQSSQSRQNRLQHLTTQLLWRLQQASPNHPATKTQLVIPVLPEASFSFNAFKYPGKLISGLEESHGALYEIGVSDDGTIVGLCLDELEESLELLRAMAYSLGCEPCITRLIVVGSCHWLDQTASDTDEILAPKHDSLWVAEVYVGPCQKGDISSERPRVTSYTSSGRTATSGTASEPRWHTCQGQQLRVSFTGSTTSGKTSLLGTLSTSTLDNGRGKSRLSLLRHRHEIVSGLTSSLAQELIGYQHVRETSGTDITATKIINYASANISSWADIHNASERDRLVFLTDSAGHPKFRRTTVRGLISWAPHWTLCCVAADDDEDSNGRVGATASSDEVLGLTGGDSDLSKAHLELCLKLALPLIILITKLDLASKIGLRQTLTKVLSIVKCAGRKPLVLAAASSSSHSLEARTIPSRDQESMQRAIDSIRREGRLLVPIILTSAVTGVGIGQVHALLSELPLDSASPCEARLCSYPPDSAPLSPLFHVDEIFALGDSSKSAASFQDHARPRFILSGYVRYGTLQIGNQLILGPFATDTSPEHVVSSSDQRSKSLPGLSRSLPRNLTAPHPTTPPSSSVHKNGLRQQRSVHEWQTVQVTSLRYLRLPVPRLCDGQVGTVGISTDEDLFLNAEPCIRRGMILSKASPSDLPLAYRSIAAVFAEPNVYVNPGSMVTLYTASIRTQAKIVEVKVPEDAHQNDHAGPHIFAFDENRNLEELMDENKKDETMPPIEEIEIKFRFTNSPEWVELGTNVLVTPASGISMLHPPSNDTSGDGAASGGGSTGLDGFVGRIVRGS